MDFHFEFDRTNGILLGRFDGHLTEESGAAFYGAIRKHGIATGAKAGIWDFSGSTENVPSDTIRRVAKQAAAMPDPTKRPCFIIAPSTHLFGLSRMFQISGEHQRPLLQVVRTLNEAQAALGVATAHFVALEGNTAA